MDIPITLETTVDELKVPLEQCLVLSVDTRAADMGAMGVWNADPNKPVLIQKDEHFILATTLGRLLNTYLPRTWTVLGASLRPATPPPAISAQTSLVTLGTRMQQMLADAEWLVVVDEAQNPVGLLKSSRVREALSALQISDWPADWQKDISLDAVITLDDTVTLHEIATRFRDEAVTGETQLASYDHRNGRWVVYTVQDLLDAIGRTMPQPGPDYPLSRLLGRLNATPAEPIELHEAVWNRIQSELDKIRPLLAWEKQPTWTLKRSSKVETLRSVGIKGIDRAGSLSEFIAQYAAGPESAAEGGRVVNAWFADERQRPVASTRALAANTLYYLGVNIGAPDPRGHVEGEQPQVPAQIIAALAASGEEVVFRLDSEDFLLLEREKRATLSTARTTADVYLRLVTPVQTGRCWLRLGVYVRENLIQSYRIFAHVAPTEGEIPEQAAPGWWSRCEYTLSADLTNLDALEHRRVCIWVGDGRAATQRIGLSVDGFNLGDLPPINVALINSAFAEYRQILGDSCYDHQTAQYLYHPVTHEPLNPNLFEEGMKNLAEIGRRLYLNLLGTQPEALAERLKTLERNLSGPLVIQIARLTLDMTFPWAVLYDRPFRFHPLRNRVCDRFVNGSACRTDCPYHSDRYLVCPYAFWGFRYIIEQPLRPPDRYSSVIIALPGDTPQLHLTFGPELGLAREHAQIVLTIVGSRPATLYGDRHISPAAQNTDALLAALSKGMTLAYFYCHGGNQGQRQWLQIGVNDPLFPDYLEDELREAWKQNNSAPLVVLNGCHTAKYTPNTFLSFIHRLGALGAAGVIGTEMPIHEYLGRYFGEFFLQRFLKGDPVGQIIYDLRLDLLKRRNFLGLMYVPYCYATLHLERTR